MVLTGGRQGSIRSFSHTTSELLVMSNDCWFAVAMHRLHLDHALCLLLFIAIKTDMYCIWDRYYYLFATVHEIQFH